MCLEKRPVKVLESCISSWNAERKCQPGRWLLKRIWIKKRGRKCMILWERSCIWLKVWNKMEVDWNWSTIEIFEKWILKLGKNIFILLSTNTESILSTQYSDSAEPPTSRKNYFQLPDSKTNEATQHKKSLSTTQIFNPFWNSTNRLTETNKCGFLIS